MELRTARDTFLEETTVLNARNEELAQLSAQYTRRIDVATSENGHVKSAALEMPRVSSSTFAAAPRPA